MNLPFGELVRSVCERAGKSLRVHILEAPGVANFFARLSSRERVFLGAAALGLGVTVGYVFVIDPLWEARARLRARVAAKEREVREVAALGRTYETLRQEVDRLRPPQSATLSPFAVLEGLAMNTFGRDKLAAISPAGRETYDGVEQETIELKLSGVSLQEVVALLYKIDTAGSMLRCTSLTIKKQYKDPYTYDVALTAVALTPR
jgi:type II secretory pathway component PulM